MHTIKAKTRLVAIVLLWVLLLSLTPLAYGIADTTPQELTEEELLLLLENDSGGNGGAPQQPDTTTPTEGTAGNETTPTQPTEGGAETTQTTTTPPTTTEPTNENGATLTLRNIATTDASLADGLNAIQGANAGVNNAPPANIVDNPVEQPKQDDNPAPKQKTKLSVASLTCSPESGLASITRGLTITLSGLNGTDSPSGRIAIQIGGETVASISNLTATGATLKAELSLMGKVSDDNSFRVTAGYVAGDDDAYEAGDSASATLHVTEPENEQGADTTPAITVTSLTCTPATDALDVARELTVAFTGLNGTDDPTGTIVVTANDATIAVIESYESPATFTSTPDTWPQAEDGQYALSAAYIPGENDIYIAGDSASASTTIGEPEGDNPEDPARDILDIGTAKEQATDPLELIAALNADLQRNAAPVNIALMAYVGAGDSCDNQGTEYSYTMSTKTAVYTGTTITPDVTVKKNSNTTLVKGKDYTVTPLTGSDFISVGAQGVEIKGIGANEFTFKDEFKITKAPSTITLAAEMVGTDLQMEAIVGNTAGAYGGTVTFTIVSSRYPTITKTVDVSATGKATFTQSGMTSALYTVSAVYNGDANHDASSVATTAALWMPTVRLSITNTGTRGEYTTVLVTVTGSRTGYTPRGTVTLKLDGSTLTELRLDSSGQATYTLWNYPWSYEKLVAEYNGDTIYASARSKPLSRWDESKLLPTITFDADVGSGSKATTLSALVLGARWEAVPTGFVAFYSGDELLGTVRLDGYGEAVFTWKNVPNGTHSLQALYLGDDLFRSVSATKTISKKASSSGSSSSGKGTGTGTTTADDTSTPLAGGLTGSEDVLLRDINGAVLSGYDTTSITVQNDGVIVLETTAQQDYYSYGFKIPRLNELATTRQDGYFNIVTPSLNMRVPYDLAAGLDGLTEYVNENKLTLTQLELRLIVREVSDNAIESAYRSAYPDSTPTALVRVEVALYSGTGKRLDYIPTEITSMLQLILPSSATATADWYDDQTQTFSPVTVENGTNAMMLQIAHNGIYVISW